VRTARHSRVKLVVHPGDDFAPIAAIGSVLRLSPQAIDCATACEHLLTLRARSTIITLMVSARSRVVIANLIGVLCA
jgi:hypothetical protein